jgi:alkyl hydroperoxide reductase subunit AhpC
VTNNSQNEQQPFCATRDDQAPTFSTSGFVNGEIKTFELEKYKGKWLLLFFYPSDFTPV